MEQNVDLVELWFHYEEVAMHFNELLIQFRLQLLGGAGAIGAVSSYLIGGKVQDVLSDTGCGSWSLLAS